MALKIKVKVSGIQDLSNARYCAGMGVDYLGFDMDTIAIEKFNEIKNWLVGVQIVGQTKTTNFEELNAKIELFKPDLLEIYDEEFYKNITQKIELPIICHEIDSVKNDKDFIQVVLDSDLDCIDGSRCIVDVSGSKIDKLEFALNFDYINITAGTEIRPGFSNFDEIMDWLEALEVD